MNTHIYVGTSIAQGQSAASAIRRNCLTRQESPVKSSVFGPVCVALPFTLALAVTGIQGQAQSENARRGGPRDWSHSRLVASRFGPDNGEKISKDWRTALKHAQLDRAAEQRALIAERPRSFDLGEALLNRHKNRPVAEVEGEAKLDWNLATGGFGSVVGSPAKYSFDIATWNCSDVVYFTVDQPGSASAVNVIAITNPYASCPGNPLGTTPTVKFGIAMVAGTATSVVPSLDGTILYVLESRVGTVILHAINVNNVTGSGAYDFTANTWSGARALSTASFGTSSEQLFEITFASTTNNVSSPYLDYDANSLYFGDSSGWIHKVENVHLATAAKNTTNFPVRCGANQLQSPVFVNQQVVTTGFDGRAYRINTTVPPPAGLYVPVVSAQIGGGTGVGVGGALSAVVIDVSNAKIIMTSNSAFGLRGVGFIDLLFAANASYASGVTTGAASSTIAPQPVALDEAFWSTGNGNIYTPGAPTSGAGTYLSRVPYNGNLVTAVAGFATLMRAGAAQSVATSPVTEFLTALTPGIADFVFIGGGSGNYRYINRIGAGFLGTNNTPVAMTGSFQNVGLQGVISGIVIDTRNTSMTGTTAKANVYYGTVGVAATTQSRIVQLAQQF
jgi:hypothetical protein